MKVRYIYSACIVIETADVKVCCDPWFTDGIYEGSWYQYPKIQDPLIAIGKIDFVYISHIHPDHYDPIWLRKILEENPSCEIIIGAENQRHLEGKMKRDGFQPKLFHKLQVGQTELACFPNFPSYPESIDSALVVRQGTRSVVNMNDCPLDSEQIERVKMFCAGSEMVAFLPYAGAGPYPQRYLFASDAERVAEAERKQEKFLNLFTDYVKALNPRLAVPFAGLYYLGGSLRQFNASRGVPDAVSAAQRAPGVGVVLQEGIGEIDLVNFSVHNARQTEFSAEEIDLYLTAASTEPFAYERYPMADPAELFSEFAKAVESALRRTKLRVAAWLCVTLGDGTYGCVKLVDGSAVQRLSSLEQLNPREEIHLDARLLFGLLHRKNHWNNAEIGSHFEFRRVGMEYSKPLYDFLSFLHL